MQAILTARLRHGQRQFRVARHPWRLHAYSLEDVIARLGSRGTVKDRSPLDGAAET